MAVAIENQTPVLLLLKNRQFIGRGWVKTASQDIYFEAKKKFLWKTLWSIDEICFKIKQINPIETIDMNNTIYKCIKYVIVNFVTVFFTHSNGLFKSILKSN